MDNWVKLLFLIENSFFGRHHCVKKIQNIKSPSNKALGKVIWLKKFKKKPQLKEGDKVYLLIKNFRNKKPSKKLDYIKVGSFLMDK